MAEGNHCYLMNSVLKGCFVSDLMKVAQLTEAKKKEATSADLCSGNVNIHLTSYFFIYFVIFYA